MNDFSNNHSWSQETIGYSQTAERSNCQPTAVWIYNNISFKNEGELKLF